MTTTSLTPHALNARNRYLKNEAEAHARAERFKRENEKLKGLIRAHYRAVHDGPGNWGDTEAALWKAVGR